jgi:hypothetical protein
MAASTRHRQAEATRRLRRRVAIAAAGWSMAVTVVALLVVGMTLFGGASPSIESDLASGTGRGGPLRDLIVSEAAPLVDERISGARDTYRGKAIGASLLVVTAVGAVSGAVGWWWAGRGLHEPGTVGRPGGRPRQSR